jgi:hypothetical protein
VGGYNGDNLVKTESVTLAQGRGNYSVEFSEPVTQLTFTYYKASGNFGIDDIVVRDVGARDSTVWSGEIEAPATAATVTGLANAKAYYYRVRAISGTAASEWSAPKEVLFLEAPANVRYDSGKYLDDGFAVAWNAAYGAVSYRVVVRESRTEENVPVLFEDFSGGKTAPDGWVFSGVDEYTTTGSSGEAPKSLKFDKEGASILTPVIPYPTESVSFWCKANGNNGGTLRVEAFVDGEWQTIRDLSPSTAPKGETEKLDIPTETKRLSITMTAKGDSTNFAFDDFVVLGTGPVFYDFGTFTTTDTRVPLVGARAERLYRATVTSVSDGGEVSAPMIEEMSPPNNPVTLIRVR